MVKPTPVPRKQCLRKVRSLSKERQSRGEARPHFPELLLVPRLPRKFQCGMTVERRWRGRDGRSNCFFCTVRQNSRLQRSARQRHLATSREGTAAKERPPHKRFPSAPGDLHIRYMRTKRQFPIVADERRSNVGLKQTSGQARRFESCGFGSIGTLGRRNPASQQNAPE